MVKVNIEKIVNTTSNFIVDLLDQLIEEAYELKESSMDDFAEGRLFSYYQIISRLMSQADAFGLSGKLPERLNNFSPESLLSKNQ